MEQNYIEKMSSDGAEVPSKINGLPDTTETDIEETFNMIMTNQVEQSIDAKVQAAFTEVVGSYQLKTISTDNTFDIMKDNDMFRS